MADTGIKYGDMVQEALRGVVRLVLERIVDGGLEGDQHLYIGFDTGHGGVTIPASLRKRYPEEMTVVIQHKFWNLEVGRDAFSLDLSFAGKTERLTIPYGAVTSFLDPSVPFGLQWKVKPGALDAEALKLLTNFGDERRSREPEGSEGSPGNVIDFDIFRKK